MQIWCTYGDKRKIETRNVGHFMAATIFIALPNEVLATRSVKEVLGWRCPFNLSLVGSLSHFTIWQ